MIKSKNLSSRKGSKARRDVLQKIIRTCNKCKFILFLPLFLIFLHTTLPSNTLSHFFDDQDYLSSYSNGQYQKRYMNSPDAFTFINATTRLHGHKHKNESCILVGCHTWDAPGYQPYTTFYANNSSFPLRMTAFTKLQHNHRDATPHWCRIPSVLETLREFPKARVVYIDLDTRTDPTIWCNMPLLSEEYIIMNSVHRRPREEAEEYFVQGTQVQSNIFVVMAEPPMKRWEALYNPNITLYDQGVIHLEEKGQLCGVPGWISCHNNPIENRCHCTGKASYRGKKRCIETMFEAPDCPNKEPKPKKINTGEFA